MTGLGWKRVGLLELTALPDIAPDRWINWVRGADVLLVDGGDATFLRHWLGRSGFSDLLPSLDRTTWIGVSAGSMVLTPRVGRDFVQWNGAEDDAAPGLVDFSISPHLDHPEMPGSTIEAGRERARYIAGPAYAIDDETAIAVVDGTVRVISEGQWHQLA